MTDTPNADLSPDPPHSPGTPSLADLDVDEPSVRRTEPSTQDGADEADAPEPPD